MKTTTRGTIIQPVKVSTYQKPLPWLEAEDWVPGLLFTTLLVSLCTWCSRVRTLLSRSTRDGNAWPPVNASDILYRVKNGVMCSLIFSPTSPHQLFGVTKAGRGVGMRLCTKDQVQIIGNDGTLF